MSNELSIQETRTLSEDLSKSKLMPADLQKSPDDIQVIIMTGRELGLGVMQSIRSIHVIKGKPCLSANLMGALCLRHPSCVRLYPVESSAIKCTYEAVRKDTPPVRITWTIEQAAKAGVTNNDNWRKYPDAMLRARCLSAICRAVWPDAVGGLYDPDELDAEPRQVQATISVVESPRPSPPTDVQFTEGEDLGLKLWGSVVAQCADEAALLNAWNTLTKEQKHDTAYGAAYTARRREIKVAAVQPAAPTEAA